MLTLYFNIIGLSQDLNEKNRVTVTIKKMAFQSNFGVNVSSRFIFNTSP